MNITWSTYKSSELEEACALVPDGLYVITQWTYPDGSMSTIRLRWYPTAGGIHNLGEFATIDAAREEITRRYALGEKDRLPVCDVCKEYPIGGGTAVSCMTPGCGMRGAVLCEYEWRRLMSRPRLAKEHVERMLDIAECAEYGTLRSTCKRDADAIRAALAALEEE